MNLRHLQALVAVVDAGGFQAAAERLRVTQSAVSMQIKALETELGVALFDRARRPPLLTVAGRTAVERARVVLSEAEALRAAAADPDAVAGTLHVGTIPTAATGFLPDALALLAARHPRLQARVESGLSDVLLQRVAVGGLDAAVVTESGEEPADLAFLPIREEALVVVAALETASAVKRDAATAWGLLAARPFIRFNRATGVGRVIDRRLEKEAVRVEDAMELDSIEAILMMVSRGLGVAVVPERSVQGDVSERLWAAPFGDPPAVRRVALAVRRRTGDEPAIAALHRALSDALASDDAAAPPAGSPP